MANVTLMGASYTDVPAVTLPKTGGGTVTFYENGGGSASTKTGTFIGSGTINATITCDFAPDLIEIYGNLTGSSSLRGVSTVVIVKDLVAIQVSDTSNSNTNVSLQSIANGITGYNGSNTSQIHASYSGTTLTVSTGSNTTANRFNSSVTYSYKLVKWS